jgi:hypothetical protein
MLSIGGLVVQRNLVKWICVKRICSLFLTAVLAVLFVACGNSGCAIRKNGGAVGESAAGKSAKDPRAVLAARVSPAWQKSFIERSRELKAVESWGLFSESGWADDGQTMIHVLPDGTAKVEVVYPGGRAANELSPVSAADVLKLRKDLEPLDGLEDHVAVAYDAIQYEIVHLVPVAGDAGLDVKTRIMAVRPLPETAPKHVAVIRTIQAIRDARAKP